MKRVQSAAVVLTEKLCRPQRIGVFGHRGVGKTTLLTMLYREAVGGRLPGCRLAAADARTATYLSDKVLQLESGQPLPATLGETELRFHLYHNGSRLELLFKDYQGEHVALGREEPIRDFLRDCDAIWLCLDVPVTASADACLRAQQEVEQMIEDYLQAEQPGAPPRPTALVITKADLLRTDSAPLPCPAELARQHFGMTLHTLALHCPQYATLAVSSLGGSLPLAVEGTSPAPFKPQPDGLEAPLGWLAETLQAQDEQRLEHLWKLAPRNVSLLARAVAAFARRYPEAPSTAAFQRRLRTLQHARQQRRLGASLVAVLGLLLGLWTYDAWGLHQVEQFAAGHSQEPALVRSQWESYQRWHPTRHLLHAVSADRERLALHDLDERVAELDLATRRADLIRRAADPDADPELAWQQLLQLQRDFPEQELDATWQQLRDRLRERYNAQRENRARLAFEELERRETRADLPTLLEQANRFLRDHAGTTFEADVRRRRARYLTRLDERDIEAARAYSVAHPLNFYTRRQHYQHYLDHHPEGVFAREATDAIAAITEAWDKHDFRAVRDHFEASPGDVKQLQPLCRSYLAVHPKGRFASSATELLRWSEQVTTTGEYKVTLRSGNFDHKVAHLVSRGPYLSVEIEVAGVHYGPSNIVPRRYDPDWNYQFPRRIRWKLGDSVRIHVVDHYYWKRQVLDIDSEENDPLAIRMLSGEVNSGKNTLTFESDFSMPTLPKIE